MTVERTCRWMIRASDPVGFEKLLADERNVLSELAGFGQRAVDAASQVTHTVGVAETEFGSQFTQRTGRHLPRQPCGNVSADGLGTTVSECPWIDPVVRGHCGKDPAQINGRNPASRGH